MQHQPSFIQRGLRAWLLGLPGVAALPFLIDVPAGIPAAALAVGPAILLTIFAFAGAWASARTDVVSRLILRDKMVLSDLAFAIMVGILAGLAVAVADQAGVSLWRGETSQPASVIENFSWQKFILGVLYGGLTEEVIFRWGISSIIVVLALFFLPRRVALTVSMIVTAVLFAVAHLPAAFAGAEIWHGGAVVRTLGWNALLGLLFGAIFFEKGLEAAILAHVGYHCGAAAAVAAF